MDRPQLTSSTIDIINQCLDFLIPRRCLSCNSSNCSNAIQICAPCLTALPYLTNCCHQCGQQLTAQRDYCGACISKPPHFDQVFAPFEYSSSVRDLIIKFKYGETPTLAKPLAHLFHQQFFEQGIETPDLLISVPMHHSRLRQRGYNQSIELCRHLSRVMGIPTSHKIIAKCKLTPAQANLNLKRRKQNMRGSFSAGNPMQFNHIAIVDDVITTGATANEIAKVLKQMGVDYVQVWTLAHAL